MSKKLAVIEDDQAIREMYELKLKTAGYNVQTASNGALGLKLIEKFQPDLILIDLMMPELTGDEVIEAMRQQPWGQKIKVIVLTNVSRDETPKSLAQCNVDDYIVKASSTPSEVLDAVRRTIG